MADLKTRIYLRNDVLSAWNTADPVLGKGEAAIVFDPSATGENRKIKIKVGDGVNNFSDLPFIADYDSAIGGLETEIQAIEKLPAHTGQMNLYLHLNNTTGALEWSAVAQGSASFQDLSGDPRDNTKLALELTTLEGADTALSGRIAVIEGDYLTSTDRTALENAIAAVKQFEYKVVTALPSTQEEMADEKGKILLFMPAGKTSYEEYIVIDNGVDANPRYALEKFGDTDIKLADYRTSAAQDAIDDAIKARVLALETAGYATESYADAAASAAASAANSYTDNAVSGLASESYVDSAVSGLASESYVDNHHDSTKQATLTDGIGTTVNVNKIDLDFTDIILNGGAAADWPDSVGE